MLLYCHTLEELERIASQSENIVVCCYSDWCPACSESKPMFERLSRELEQTWAFAKIRTDEDEELAAGLGIEAIPTFLIIRNKRLLDWIEGAVAESELRSAMAASIEN